MECSSSMKADIHQGEVIHSMDHFVLDLTSTGGAKAYFSIYALGFMKDVGAGMVALLRLDTPNGLLDRCFGETISLATRMQARLRTMRHGQGNAPNAGLEHAPTRASIRRSPSTGQSQQWVVESASHTISASWTKPEPPIWLSAPAPAFHPSRDYFTAMVSYDSAELVVDESAFEGSPYRHGAWEDRLGRPFSSCHAALSEVAVESS